MCCCTFSKSGSSKRVEEYLLSEISGTKTRARVQKPNQTKSKRAFYCTADVCHPTASTVAINSLNVTTIRIIMIKETRTFPDISAGPRAHRVLVTSRFHSVEKIIIITCACIIRRTILNLLKVDWFEFVNNNKSGVLWERRKPRSVIEKFHVVISALPPFVLSERKTYWNAYRKIKSDRIVWK